MKNYEKPASFLVAPAVLAVIAGVLPQEVNAKHDGESCVEYTETLHNRSNQVLDDVSNNLDCTERILEALNGGAEFHYDDVGGRVQLVEHDSKNNSLTAKD